MKTHALARLIAGAILLGSLQCGYTQAETPAVAANGKKPITFSARSVQGILAKGKQDTILVGSVNIVTGSLVITADRVELSGEDYVNVACSGNVIITDTEKGFSMVAEKCSYQRDTEIGIAQGKVAVDDTKNSTVINAEWVKFDQQNSIFEAAISVLVLKEDMSIRAEYAHYNRNTEEIKLHGGAVAITEEGSLKGDVISASSDWSNLQISGQVSGNITSKENAPSQ